MKLSYHESDDPNMKIKYLDLDEPKLKKSKNKKWEFNSFLIGPIVFGSTAILACLTMIGTAIVVPNSPKEKLRNQTYSVTENGEAYSLDDLYILYKEDNSKLCYRYENKEGYFFIDTNDNSSVAFTKDFTHDSFYPDEDQIITEESMNGYNVKSLYEIMLEDNKQNKKGWNTSYATEEYIDTQVENYIKKQ